MDIFWNLGLRSQATLFPKIDRRTIGHCLYSAPALQSVNELNPLCEHFTSNNNDELQFSHTTFAYVTSTDEVYFGRSLARKYHLTVPEVNASLMRVPDEDMYPIAPPHVTTANANTANQAHYEKGPMLTAYDELRNTGQVALMLLQEVEIYERLKMDPHPNLVHYHGCRTARGRVVGIILTRYPFLLEDYLLLQRAEGYDVNSGFNDIKSGVFHLHSLKLAHNDIKPSNIMVGQDGRWVLIDMGSSKPFGSTLTSAGTSGWYQDDWTTSEKEHDEAALSKLWDWLQSIASSQQLQSNNNLTAE